MPTPTNRFILKSFNDLFLFWVTSLLIFLGQSSLNFFFGGGILSHPWGLLLKWNSPDIIKVWLYDLLHQLTKHTWVFQESTNQQSDHKIAYLILQVLKETRKPYHREFNLLYMTVCLLLESTKHVQWKIWRDYLVQENIRVSTAPF